MVQQLADTLQRSELDSRPWQMAKRYMHISFGSGYLYEYVCKRSMKNHAMFTTPKKFYWEAKYVKTVFYLFLLLFYLECVGCISNQNTN